MAPQMTSKCSQGEGPLSAGTPGALLRREIRRRDRIGLSSGEWSWGAIQERLKAFLLLKYSLWCGFRDCSAFSELLSQAAEGINKKYNHHHSQQLPSLKDRLERLGVQGQQANPSP